MLRHMVHLLFVSIPLHLSFTIGLSLFDKSTCEFYLGMEHSCFCGKAKQALHTGTSPS
jgi:hypothetical protein